MKNIVLATSIVVLAFSPLFADEEVKAIPKPIPTEELILSNLLSTEETVVENDVQLCCGDCDKDKK